MRSRGQFHQHDTVGRSRVGPGLPAPSAPLSRLVTGTRNPADPSVESAMFPITSGASSHPELSPLSLVRMLWKSKLLTGMIWIFLCLLSGAIVYSIPSMYRAEAVILVDSQKVPERYVASTVNADVQDRLAVISQHILSSNRL